MMFMELWMNWNFLLMQLTGKQINNTQVLIIKKKKKLAIDQVKVKQELCKKGQGVGQCEI